ncbi:glycosyltransferase family 4 protein [Leucobacter viscericola]|uniref:D-inositol 3-phosphate glycosyltransferase n=1 Tax=Leucobacter viscericola TaxID=2714935 RepID=A0A6G7XH35_9MICO|nr:glycosyltransferase [Leucobacter viscericola]QIK63681.1 glycosyltransferase family 4 protein [Leucobacter viscericola]
MHILIVTDQHVDSLGGVQVAIRLQRRFLERAGHRVTIAAPAMHRPGYVVADKDRGAYIDLPSRPITKDREYGISWPGHRTDHALAKALATRPPVDVVHVQGDFWGALIGIRAARGLGVPVVLTMHNNVDEGTRAVTRLAPLVFTVFRAWRGLALGRCRGKIDRATYGAWRYLAELATEAAVVAAPSQHFARELQRHRVVQSVVVIPNGVDDDTIESLRSRERSPRERPKLIWLGRMSKEKRVLEFIEAIAESGIDADVTLYGAGMLLPRVIRRVRELGLEDRVTIPGPVPYREALIAIHDADALVQASIGFETQGLTPFEAAALGTPTIFCDAQIAQDVAVETAWQVADASVTALAETLGAAVSELAAAPGQLRVSARESQRFLQSMQTAKMVALYEQASLGV